ncbi:MAG TPA: TIGR00282 family metallophosphoesterase [Candidatus Hydrogenedentes bacterium]|nr:TIGR00282 family metallophosphoesterase [Candidatus Hydrogenedentota bacterium]
MRILFIGDVVGRAGRQCVARWLSGLCAERAVDLTVANGENAAGGIGATPEVLVELQSSGVQIITLGNHTWKKKELMTGLDALDNVVRPANFPAGVPGQGALVYALPDGRQVGFVNLVGRVFMDCVDCPFVVGKREVERLREVTPLVLVDFHAEATAEKVAMGWYLDGLCTAVIGTHTHVQTADERILPNGTAYISDVGMTGALDSVIGVERDLAIHRFITGMPTQFKAGRARPGLCGVVVEADDATGRARTIERIARVEETRP